MCSSASASLAIRAMSFMVSCHRCAVAVPALLVFQSNRFSTFSTAVRIFLGTCLVSVGSRSQAARVRTCFWALSRLLRYKSPSLRRCIRVANSACWRTSFLSRVCTHFSFCIRSRITASSLAFCAFCL